MNRSIELIFFDAGGGHRNAATALQQVMKTHYPHWSVTLVNLQELLSSIDPVSKITRYKTQDIYNAILKNGWTYGSRAMLRSIQQAIKFLGPLCEEKLRAHWAHTQPDMVVSLIPNFNAIMFRALRSVARATPYVTVMTDMADCPPHFWLEPQDQFVICGSDKAVQQAHAIGLPSNNVFRASGMIIRPDYYQAPTPLTHAELGLNPALPTALVMFGGYASKKAETVVKQLAKCAQPVQSIVLCGHNAVLQKTLQNMPNCHAVGFTPNVQSYMHLASFFIGKPGPGSISEALHMGLPVIVELNQRTLLQERFNAEWVQQQGVGITINSLGAIPAAVEKILQPDTYAAMRRTIQSFTNRAVFEVPEFLETIFEKSATVNTTVSPLSREGERGQKL